MFASFEYALTDIRDTMMLQGIELSHEYYTIEYGNTEQGNKADSCRDTHWHAAKPQGNDTANG